MAQISAEDRILQLEQQVTRLQHRLTAEQSKVEALQYRLSQQERQQGQSGKIQAPTGQTSNTEGSLPEQVQCVLQLQQMSLDRTRVAAEKADLENALEAEQEYIMHKLSKQLQAVKHDREMLGMEKQGLKSKVKQLNQSVRRLCQEKVELERSLELEEEAFVNSLFRQVAHVMDNYHAMDQAMQKHGIRITQMAPQSPRVVLKRSSLVSHASADGTSTPTAAVRTASPVVPTAAAAAPQRGGGMRPQSARRESMPFASNSPGASLHATREHLEALSRSALRHNTVRSEDSMGSMSSMGSMMSAMSRDPSASREGMSLPTSSAASGGGHGAMAAAHAAAAAAAAHGPQSAPLGNRPPSSVLSTPSESGRLQK